MKYRKIIEHLAKNAINQRFPNGFREHELILIEAMFNHAKNDICIFSDSLNVLNESPFLLRAATQFLQKQDTQLKILLQDINRSNLHQLVSKVEGYGLEIRKALGAYSNSNAKYFTVMDRTGFRFEHDHFVIANFYEPKTAEKLHEVFNQAFNLGQNIDFGTNNIKPGSFGY